MQQQPAYTITHVHLDRQQPPTATSSNLQSGSYHVFWWKEIALGQLFLKPGERLSEEAYLSSLVAAIQPSLQQYANKESGEGSNWQQLLLNKEYGHWATWMESTFSSWIPTEIPATVPVSVVICTRNRAGNLTKCLEQLSHLSCLPEEIIVVDNAPSDNSTFQVVNQFSNTVYVEEPRAGLDIARNTGLLKARNAIIAFTDDDVLVHPLWIYWVWRTFQDTSAAAMTGLIIAAELRTKAQVNFEKYWSFNRGYTDKTYAVDYFNSTLPKGPPVWEIGAGANMAFRKSIFEDAGLFNEYLDVGAAGCNGDSEMWYRILANGQSIHYNPRAIVFHEHRRETAGLKKQIFYYMRGFTVAALLQQKQQEKAGYNQHLFRVLPKFYFSLLKKGFPLYRSRTSTIWAEMKGMLSGLVFYKRNQHSLLKSIRK